MSESGIINKTVLEQWSMQKMTIADVEDNLRHKGLSKDVIAEHLITYRKLLSGKKLFFGFLCMGLGAFLGFISCVLAIVNPVPELHDVFLYGLTSIAILIVFYGLYLVFE